MWWRAERMVFLLICLTLTSAESTLGTPPYRRAATSSSLSSSHENQRDCRQPLPPISPTLLCASPLAAQGIIDLSRTTGTHAEPLQVWHPRDSQQALRRACQVTNLWVHHNDCTSYHVDMVAAGLITSWLRSPLLALKLAARKANAFTETHSEQPTVGEVRCPNFPTCYLSPSLCPSLCVSISPLQAGRLQNTRRRKASNQHLAKSLP